MKSFPIGTRDLIPSQFQGGQSTCLTDTPAMTPEDIRFLHEREYVSQPIFATYLNVSKNLVSDWERGVQKPEARRFAYLISLKSVGWTL